MPFSAYKPPVITPLRDPKHILIGVCLRSMETRWETMMSFLKVLNNQLPEYTLEVVPAGGGSVCYARNLIVHHWRTRSQAGRLHFIDSDIIFDERHLARLYAHENTAVISGLYPLKDTHFRWNYTNQVGEHDGLIAVDEVATGFLLLDYHKVYEPLAEASAGFLITDPAYRGETGREVFRECVIDGRHYSEDFYLSMRIRTLLGLPIWIDPTIQCGHIGSFNYLKLFIEEQARAGAHTS